MRRTFTLADRPQPRQRSSSRATILAASRARAGGAPWLWVSRARISDAAAVEAVSRGAYDAIPLGEPGAIARLLRRLTELQAPQPAPPESDVLVTRSAAWPARHPKPFIPINCGAIPDELMEAELFGYVRGAFSGAVHQYDGQLMAAA